MTLSLRSRKSVLILMIAFATIAGGVLASLELRGAIPHAHAKAADYTHANINCVAKAVCLDPVDPEQFGEEYGYVGHDEPSNLFYSNVPGSGNRNLWLVRLPKEPTLNPTPSAGQSFNFELHPAFWFGMAMCDTQSYPETVSTCTPDSNSNIVDPAVSANHPGTAFMEMQFYPPGWAPFQLPGGISCDATKWCAALNIDSLSQNGVTGQFNNPACEAAVGDEYVNFAFITRNGIAQAPASPLLSTAATITPDLTKDLFMSSGDLIAITMHDTFLGLRIDLFDLTTFQHGSMTASKFNGFGEVLYDPTGSNCNPATHNIPTNFHPMYATSSPATRVIWAAHSYNIAFSDEIGHFDFCSNPQSDGTCSGTEGQGANTETTDGDDNFCQPASASLLYLVNGCAGENDGFDGVPYQDNVWPAGNNSLNPTPIQFSSPVTGAGYNVNYTSSAFETDLPRIEVAGIGISHNNCIRSGAGAGTNCFLFPLTDDSPTPNDDGSSDGTLIHAPFYPYYSATIATVPILPQLSFPTCMWQIGGAIPGSNLFGQNNQYGNLLPLHFLPVGSPTKIDDFQGVQNVNPCALNPSVASALNLFLHDD